MLFKINKIFCAWWSTGNSEAGVEPITAILVGALAFGEPVTMNVLIGIGLTMAAVTFMIVSSNK